MVDIIRNIDIIKCTNKNEQYVRNADTEESMSKEISDMLSSVEIPRMVLVRQKFDSFSLPPASIDKILYEQFTGISASISPGMRVAIAVGSRGIANLVQLVRTTVDYLISCGAKPFIVPAMGSHGGGTAAGQAQLLKNLGIVESTVHCPVISSVETVRLDTVVDGQPVFMDSKAFAADGVVMICRVKPHTDFRGRYESGMLKMLTVGLGKPKGAQIFHQLGQSKMAYMLQRIGQVILSEANILFAVTVVENAYDATYSVDVVKASEILDKEPELLVTARRMMPQILVDECDVLIVDEIGKDISGAGMDPNVSGTFVYENMEGGVKANQVCVLDVTEASHGNALGIGMAHATTRRLEEKLDRDSMYLNSVTAGTMLESHIPPVMENDLDAIRLCMWVCRHENGSGDRIIRIKNTLRMEHIMVSEFMLDQVYANRRLEIIGEPLHMLFDQHGNIKREERHETDQ